MGDCGFQNIPPTIPKVQALEALRIMEFEVSCIDLSQLTALTSLTIQLYKRTFIQLPSQLRHLELCAMDDSRIENVDLASVCSESSELSNS